MTNISAGRGFITLVIAKPGLRKAILEIFISYSPNRNANSAEASHNEFPTLIHY
jgi:hypothetical protein